MVVCNLFHKVAFMNFIFPKHCHITLSAPKCKTSFVITQDIYFVEETFLFITTYYLSHKPGIMGFNVPTNLFWNFAQVWVQNAFNWPIKTLKAPFSIINEDLIMRLRISFTKLMQICSAGFTVWQLQWVNQGQQIL